jgi:hypothetical protein
MRAIQLADTAWGPILLVSLEEERPMGQPSRLSGRMAASMKEPGPFRDGRH